MISFPNAKINLGLNILNKRSDGYHNLETIFYPVKINDALEIITSDQLYFEATGIGINGSSENNLCVKAYNLLKKDFPGLPAVKIHLHKAIPMGAGMGGGSADAAFMLSMLNTKFSLGLCEEELIEYALALGSDCPFFIYNRPCFASGRGEKLEKINIDLSHYKLVIVNPHIHISTSDAFACLSPSKPLLSIKEIVKEPVETWKERLANDFEISVFNLYPQIETIKQVLYQHGAVYSSMSGSGSTVYGIFNPNSITLPPFPEAYKIYIL